MAMCIYLKTFLVYRTIQNKLNGRLKQCIPFNNQFLLNVSCNYFSWRRNTLFHACAILYTSKLNTWIFLIHEMKYGNYFVFSEDTKYV